MPGAVVAFVAAQRTPADVPGATVADTTITDSVKRVLDADVSNEEDDDDVEVNVGDLEETSRFDLETKQMFFLNSTDPATQTHCFERDMVHPCTTELKRYLLETNETSEAGAAEKTVAARRAYDCAKTVFNHPDKQDYWTVKNMTHLLLDLDVSSHKFDLDGHGTSKFYNLGLDFGRKLLYHDDCLAEFDSKSEVEARCPLLYGKILLLKMKNAERWDDAHKLFNELKAFAWNGKQKQYAAGQAFKWRSIHQTPQMFLEGLQNTYIWPEERRKDLPIWDVLEDNFDTIRGEIEELYKDGKKYDPAYRFLFKEGEWDQVLLFHRRVWQKEGCELMPKSCALFKEAMGKREVHHYPWLSSQNEQIVVLRIGPGTDMERHSGPANNILNVHLGVSGVKDAILKVADETHGWKVGKVIPWDGSFDHSVHCKHCKEDRVILMVRYMHPDMKREFYRGAKKTHFEAIPEDFHDADWYEKSILKKQAAEQEWWRPKDAPKDEL